MNENTENHWPAMLRAWRGDHSQEWAARRVGVSLAAFQRWEAGKVRPSGLACAALEIAMKNGSDGKDQS